jgi:glycine/D-amino acid oxidase-like deaminating enzyme/nitrite reductase/ring-hydroxylating ferredoxin subunit
MLRERAKTAGTALAALRPMYDEHERNGESLPCWHVKHPTSHSDDPLDGPLPDVLILGAGIAGLSVAYHLLRAGSSVLVIDKAAIGSGESGRTTAHLCDALDDRYYLLERAHGSEGARLAAQSHRAAIESISEIVEREQIACEFERVDGYLYSYGDQPAETIEREFKAARAAGLNVELLDCAPLPFRTGRSLRFLNQAQFEPMAYLNGLAQAVRRLGGRIATDQHVVRVDNSDTALIQLANGKRLSAPQLVVATNAPIHDLFAIHTKQAPYRSYVVGLGVPSNLLSRALFWDTEDPYHYMRWVGRDLLLVGGEDHRVGQDTQSESHWLRLEEWARARIPSVAELRTCWSGQVLEPMDGLAFIGKNPGLRRNSYIVTGDSGNGMTHGALAGMLIADLIHGRKNAWATLYDPARKPKSLTAIREYLKENANVAKGYANWLKPAEDQRTEIQKGTGSVIQRGLSKLAVYVDETGGRHECSAVCPHLAGVVQWNSAENSWDCPCHGSRFDPYGRVMSGPAQTDLTPVREQPGRDQEAAAQ